MIETISNAKQSIIMALTKIEARGDPLEVARVQRAAENGFRLQHQVSLDPSDFAAALSKLTEAGVLVVDETSPPTIRRIKR